MSTPPPPPPIIPPGGPVQYEKLFPGHELGNPCFTLAIPATVLDIVREDQLRRLAMVQLRIAQRASALLAEAYGEIAMIVEAGAKRVESQEGSASF